MEDREAASSAVSGQVRGISAEIKKINQNLDLEGRFFESWRGRTECIPAKSLAATAGVDVDPGPSEVATKTTRSVFHIGLVCEIRLKILISAKS